MSASTKARRRLFGELPGLRRHLVVGTVTAVALAACLVGQAELLARGVTAAIAGNAATAATLLAVLAAVVALRAALVGFRDATAGRTAAGVTARLRGRLLRGAYALGPGELAGRRTGELVALADRGLSALTPFVRDYLPQAVLAVTVPLVVLARLAFVDATSAIVVAVTLPLIPIFGALVGMHTESTTRRQWQRLGKLSGHFLDVVAGLPTLRAFGRARAEAETVRRMADEHRSATMRALRVAFLSALVLELVAALSVALVAVPISLRLLSGQVDLTTALLVLLLAPEAYLPLRTLGARYHAAAEGLAAAEQVFGVLDATPAVPVRAGRLTGAPAAIRFERVTVRYPGQDRPALDDVSFTVERGERLALTGPSGAGKSTVLALLLGFVRPDRGRVLVTDASGAEIDLAALDPAPWRRQLAWVPQRTHLFAGTLAENIRLGSPELAEERVRSAAAAAAVPYDLTTVVGEDGAGISSGERQRVAIARALARDAPVVLLDEPTAWLDRASEAAVLTGSAALTRGRTVLAVAHRTAMIDTADRVVRLDCGCVAVPALARVAV